MDQKETFTIAQESAFLDQFREGVSSLSHAVYVMEACKFAINHPEFQEKFGTNGVEIVKQMFVY
jgi:hypothetical protein